MQAPAPPTNRPQHTGHARAFPVAALLFFVSGALGLGYELVWIRKAALVVGAGQIALSTVVAAFFLGLASGAYLFGRAPPLRRWSPLVTYGLLEIAIGLFALAFPVLFRALEAAYGALYPLVSGWAPAIFALRFLLLFGLFLIPTALMGGTLPLLLDGLIERDESLGSRASLLYALNVLGAVAGVLLTGYLAIPLLGMNGTSLAGGGVNIALGIAACLAFRRVAPLHPAPENEPLGRFFPAAALVSGLLSMGYQVSWARYFSLWNPSTVYLSCILLAVHLLALGASGLLVAPLLRARWRPLTVLAVALTLAPLAAAATLEWWQAAAYRFAIRGAVSETGEVGASPGLELEFHFRDHWRLLSETADAIFCAPLFQVALVIFLPVLLLGTGLPTLIAAAARRSASLRAVSGRIIFWNTLGAGAGSFVAAYLLLPLLGLHWTLFSLGLGSLGLAAAAAWKGQGPPAAAVPQSRQERRHGGGPAGTAPLLPALQAAALLGLTAFFVLSEDVSRRAIQRHGCGAALGYSDPRPGEEAPRVKLVEAVEGPLNSSFVFDSPESARIGSGSVFLAMVPKSLPSTQAIQGHVPCLFYPGSGSPEDCLGICLGSGQSFGALLLHRIRRLDIVEISSEILDLSLRHFAPYNHDLGTDPRVKLHLDDGRHFVERAPAGWYDLVSLEPPPPTADGVASLYSLEFYREVARVLRPGGVFLQWIPLHQLTPLDAQAILRTQARVFPETFVVKVDDEQFVALSYPVRPRFPLQALRERCRTLEKERLVAGWRWNADCRHDLASLEGVLALVVMGPAEVARLPAGPLCHDDDQRLSYSSGDRWILRRYQGPLLSSITFAALPLSDFASLRDYFDPALSAELVAEAARERAASLRNFHALDPALHAARREAFRAAESPEERRAIALDLASSCDQALAKEEAFAWLEKALEAGPAADSGRDRSLALGIVRNRTAVYSRLIGRWVARLRAEFPGSPAVEAMSAALAEYQARESERRSGYLLPVPADP